MKTIAGNAGATHEQLTKCLFGKKIFEKSEIWIYEWKSNAYCKEK